MSAIIPGRCAEPGPWGTYCTDCPNHDYSHYDATDDSSWQDDWREHTPVNGGGNMFDDDETEES